jgi:hypothetical protein
VTVIYGDRDSVVPPELSARVADEAPALVERVVIHGPTTTTRSCSGRPWRARLLGSRKQTALESRRRVGGLAKLILPMMLLMWSRPYGR